MTYFLMQEQFFRYFFIIKTLTPIIICEFFWIIFFFWEVSSIFFIYIFFYRRFNYFLFHQDFFLSLHNLAWLLKSIESIYHLFSWYDLLLFFCFSSYQENLYMIHDDCDVLMTFIIKQLNIIKDKFTILHRFQIILISSFKQGC